MQSNSEGATRLRHLSWKERTPLRQIFCPRRFMTPSSPTVFNTFESWNVLTNQTWRRKIIHERIQRWSNIGKRHLIFVSNTLMIQALSVSISFSFIHSHLGISIFWNLSIQVHCIVSNISRTTWPMPNINFLETDTCSSKNDPAEAFLDTWASFVLKASSIELSVTYHTWLSTKESMTQ